MENGLLEELEKLTKSQIGEILNLTPKDVKSLKKGELLQNLHQSVANNELLFKKCFKAYAPELGLHPSKVEEYLHITRTERLRWTKEKKLKVVAYTSFTKWGKTLEYPVYDVYQIKTLSQDQIDHWLQLYEMEKKQKRKKAARKAIITRNKNKAIHKEFYEKTFKGMVNDWFKINGKLGASLQLAYWTMWISRWAKEFQVLAKSARAKEEEYLQKKELFYNMKNEAIKRLILSPYATISFFQPPNAEKITYLEFCPEHYGLWRQEREFEYLSKWDFYYSHLKNIHKCPSCEVDIEKDYYSLYYISVKHDDTYFSFHTPHPIGKAYLPKKNSLPHILHEEQEGMFRFGRALQAEEKIIFKEKEVIKNFNEAIVKFDLYMKESETTFVQEINSGQKIKEFEKLS